MVYFLSRLQMGFMRFMIKIAPPHQGIESLFGRLRFCRESWPLLGWLFIEEFSLWNMDNLRRCNIITINACHLCLSAEERVDHLLLKYKMASSLWIFVLRSYADLSFMCGISPPVPKKGKFMWRLSFLACLGLFGERRERGVSFLVCFWTIWREKPNML